MMSDQETDTLTKEQVRQLRDEVKTFLFAGHETSSMMLTWALYELTLNDQLMNKIRDEATRVWGKLTIQEDGRIVSSKNPSYSDINDGLIYTVAVLKETLRKWSVVPVVTREAAEDDTVNDVFFPQGARVVIHMKAIHRRADIWADPDRFDPERFMPDAPKHHPYAFLPFIQGPRNCVGQHFALLEAKIVLSRLVAMFDFTPAQGETGQCHHLNIPVAPVDSMRMVVKLR